MSGITVREVEVAKLYALGRSCKEAAAHLSISSATAKRHLATVYRKTGVTTHTELIAWALRRKVITVEELKAIMPTHNGGRRELQPAQD